MASGDISLQKRLLWGVALPGILAALVSCAFLWRSSGIQPGVLQPLLTGLILGALVFCCAALWIEGC